MKKGLKSFACAIMLSVVAVAQTPPDRKPDPILVVFSKGDLFEAGKTGLTNELKYDFAVEPFSMTEKTTPGDLGNKVTALSPAAVVLLGNFPISLYAKYCTERKDKTASVPVVASHALDVRRATAPIGKSLCISYETPMITALVNFRQVMFPSLEKVGVLYRKSYAEFIERNSRLCQNEKITVKSLLIGDDASTQKKEIAQALDELLNKEHIQAFWAPNDSKFFKVEYLTEIWIPIFLKTKVPVIVGVESLVKPEINFGTYAVIPDPEAMGAQAARLVEDLKDENWQIDSTVIFPAISTYSVLNLKKASMITDEKNINMTKVTKILREGKN